MNTTTTLSYFIFLLTEGEIDMKITSTPFEFTHYSHKINETPKNDYMFHNVSASNKIIIDDKIELEACYQTGLNKRYTTGFPDNSFSLASSNESNTDYVLELINETCDCFYDDEDIKEGFEEVKKLFPTIDTIKKMKRVYYFIQENEPTLNDFLDLSVYTENPDDYKPENEDGCNSWVLKSDGEN